MSDVFRAFLKPSLSTQQCISLQRSTNLNKHGGLMEVLTSLEQICSPRFYTELTESFCKLHGVVVEQQENLRDILQRYHHDSETQSGGLPVVDQTCNLLLWITDEILSVGDDQDELEHEFTTEDIQWIESLLLAFHIILTSIAKSGKEDSSGGASSAIRHIIKKTAAMTVIVCTSHMEEHEWTSHTTMMTAKEILQVLCESSQAESLSQLLSHNAKQSSAVQDGVLDEVLAILQTRLTLWPALPYVAHWCITQVMYPNLGGHLSKLLTLALKLADRHQVQHKIIGVKCLHHIMKNSNAAELTWYGRCDVIFEVLQKLFYLSEPELLQVLYPCILLNLQVMTKTDKDKMVKQYDKVIQVIFTSMEYEAKQPLRRVHMSFLKDIVNQVGIHLLCYLKRFLEIVFSYLEVYDEHGEEVRINALKALKTAMLNLWPRVGNHSSEILHALLKLIVDCSDIDNAKTKGALLDSCVQCLIVLGQCCPEYMTKTFHVLQDEVSHKEVQYCMNKAIEQEDNS